MIQPRSTHDPPVGVPSMLSLIRRIGTPAFTLLVGAMIVGSSVLLVTLLDLLLKDEILSEDLLIGALVALAVGPVSVFQFVLLTRRLDRAQDELLRANTHLSEESEALRALTQRLTEANRNLDYAQRVAKVGYYRADLESGAMECSAEFDRIFGLGAADVRDLDHWETWVHPEDRARYRDGLRACLEERGALALDFRIVPRGAVEEHWVYAYGQISPEGTGQASFLAGIVQEISERKRAESELCDMRDRLQLATAAGEFGVWDWDRRAGLVSLTPRAQAIFEWDLPQRLEQSRYFDALHARILSEDRDVHDKALQKALEGGANTYAESFRIQLPGDRIRFIEAHSCIRRDARGDPSRVVGLLQDRTALNEAEIALIEARDRAEASNRAKSEFVANVSHEIRTPLNAVMGLTHLLQQTTLSEEQADYLDKINAAGRSLLGVLNDILDFSKIEAGRLEVCSARFAMGELLGDVASMLSVSIGEKPVEILIGMADDVPQHAVGDMLRLRQVLINLAGNAVKFTEQGEVTVWLEVERSEELHNWVRFSVCDTGIGMGCDQVEGLFKPFTQADASMTRRFGGTGLGLAISKRLVELMGGTIGAASKPGVGSEFWFCVPLGLAANDDFREASVPELSKLSVLVVDDHPTARLFLRNSVERLKWIADVAQSGEEAVERFRQAQLAGRPHDVVLVDWRMPGKDGIETISEIRQIADTATPPVAILVTAHSTEAALRRDKANVVDGILIKPVTCQALLKLVADRRTSDTLPARPDSDGEDAGNRRTPLHGRRLLLVEDNAVNQVVAQRILQHAGAVVELAEDGEQAINRLADPGAPPFDLVLMDVQMPVLDGLAATRLIREQLGLQVPIVAMSAGVMASEKKRCLESGMNDFIGKPFGVAEIITLIQRHIRSARPGNVSIVSTAVGSPIPPAAISAGVLQVPGFDLTATLRRFDNDQELLNTSLLLFMREFQDLASQIERACRQGEEHELRYLVHKFRGSAANLGAVQLSSLAQEAEAALDAGRPHRHLIEALISTWQTTLPLLRAALAEPEAAVSARQGP